MEITIEEIEEWIILNEYDEYRKGEYKPISLEKFLIQKLIEARKETKTFKSEKLTSVEWLVDQMRQRKEQGLTLSFYDLEMFASYAKAMEKDVATEYAEFCIRCDRANLKQVKFEDWKKSWDETFKSE